MSTEQPPIGRGRGRGLPTDQEVSTVTTSSSASDRRTDGNGESSRGNGNGKKRGTNGNGNRAAAPAQRPKDGKQGSSGKVIPLSANYFELTKTPQFTFHQCRVDFEPETDVVGLRSFLVRSQKQALGGTIFDGQNILFLTKKLPQPTMTFNVESRDATKYVMTVRSTDVVIEPGSSMSSTILNTILRKMMGSLKMNLVGRNLYDPQSKVEVTGFRVELWPGYITSIRPHENNFLVSCEISHKVMRQDNLYRIMQDCISRDRNNWRDDFVREVVGTTVLTRYNQNTYRVADVDFDLNPETTFDQKGVQTSFVEYYRAKYNIEIRDPKQPVLVVKPKARDERAGRTQNILLIPELCTATGLTDQMRGDFRMMRAMADHTQMDPERRRTRLLEFSRRINEQAQLQMLEYNVNMSRQLVEFNGRALKQEEILFGNNKTFQNDDRVDWTAGFRNNSMYESVPLKRWILMYPPKALRETEELQRTLEQVGQGMHYEVATPRLVALANDRLSTYVEELDKVMAMDPKIIVIVVPTNDAALYAAIKQKTAVDRAIPTQVVVHRTLQPKKGNLMSVGTKIMIQINCKLGGAPWMIKFPMNGVMTVGFDVSRDTKDRKKSFGAFVASMDLKRKVQYYSGCFQTADDNEISNSIHVQMMAALKAYKNTHGDLPDRIFFYRDGVGDGQLKQVSEVEVKQLQESLKEFYAKQNAEKPIKFTFIVVTKRINTRIFKKNNQRFENPPSGTVVDNTITLPERYDFYLVSQSVRQGTVAPTSYNVITDGSELSADKLQMITYKNTHLYYNWSGTVRVPAVTQYAHKLAFLCGQSLHRSPNAGLANSLFFL